MKTARLGATFQRRAKNVETESAAAVHNSVARIPGYGLGDALNRAVRDGEKNQFAVTGQFRGTPGYLNRRGQAVRQRLGGFAVLAADAGDAIALGQQAGREGGTEPARPNQADRAGTSEVHGGSNARPLGGVNNRAGWP
jgi:hypothetical protein